ncbi:hypothetical protein RRG08_047918 [Elysia crispata]|uniref:Rhodanese domain-containing protein n=1 Tax=Elysia crispata TaxID=231223 RepID=A0AAE0ZML7_9GAST|nr:hypothetical protein RRG08_047918 [Elysia crispata]
MLWEIGAPTFLEQISAGTSRTSHICLGSPRSSFLDFFPRELPALVSSQWLIESLFIHEESNVAMKEPERHPVFLLDATWEEDSAFGGYMQHYKRGHIPGATFFDLRALCAPPNSRLSCPIPDACAFEHFVSNMGITNKSHVVTYDSLDCRYAARVWFLFRVFGHERVSVLDGGFRQWVLDGHEVCSEEYNGSCLPDQTEPQPVLLSPHPTHKFKAALQPNVHINFTEMKTLVEKEEVQIIDCRPELNANEERLSAASVNLCAMTSSTTSSEFPSLGLIKGAIHMPFINLFTPEGTYKPEPELLQEFEKAGVDLSVPAVVYSQRGISACTVALAAAICGAPNMPVYNGSWTEWQALAPHSLIVTGSTI